MNIKETNDLLVRIQVVDNRQVGDSTILAWQELLVDVDYDVAVEAVADHFRSSTDYLMPAHVIEGARRVLERRPPDVLALEAPPVDPQAGLREYVASKGIDWDEFTALREAGTDMFTAIEQLGGEGL